MGYFLVRYDSRVIIYERKMFIILATGHSEAQPIYSNTSILKWCLCRRMVLDGSGGGANLTPSITPQHKSPKNVDSFATKFSGLARQGKLPICQYLAFTLSWPSTIAYDLGKGRAEKPQVNVINNFKRRAASDIINSRGNVINIRVFY